MGMQLDVVGKIDNTSLAATRPLQPLYEAVVNSIQAIDEAQIDDGKISIHVLRETSALFNSKEDARFRPIIGFEIIDNGIGFTDDNFESFCTSDTTYKKSRGGKGVGRFVWLVAFNEVKVESVFEKDRKAWKRQFRFIAKGDGIADAVCEKADDATRATSVTLLGYHDKYQRHCPKKPETIAWHIAEHCLEFFIRAHCPQIELIDTETDDLINLNRIFEQGMVDKSEADSFDIDGNKFIATHVRLYASHASDHLAHYCANDRVVKSTKLRGKLPNVGTRIDDEQGKRFLYAVYVESDLLNDTVNAERTDFAIEDESSELFDDVLAWSNIVDAVVARSKNYLEPFTDPVHQRKKDRIEKFVAQEAPMYRPIMRYISDAVEQIDPEVTDDELDMELYRAYHALSVETRQQGHTLLSTDELPESFEGFSARLEAYFEKVTNINAADLARYVCHRKAVLDFLQKLLRVQADGRYALEQHVHNLIFPMGATSSDILLEDHNLWLVDEKLAYHTFLASDKQLRTLQPHNGDSQKEPDIIAYDATCAFASSEDDYSAITLIEFKRLMLESYSEEKNPFVQVCEYIDILRANKARSPEGREILLPDNLPFYCYVVCDMSSQLETWARLFELTKTPDAQGFFGYKKAFNAYFEVISYNKLVSDAKKRNAIFFEKLGLPPRIKMETMVVSDA